MIQRIQSVWLLVAALVSSGLFYFSVYKADTISNGVTVTEVLKATNHYPLLLVAIITVLLPLFAIFNFKDRKRQAGLTMLAILSNISFVTVAMMRIGNMSNATPAPANASYMPGAVLPVVAIAFLIMAIRAIRKDEKLVKSLDRLR